MPPQFFEDGHEDSREGEKAYGQGEVQQVHGISFSVNGNSPNYRSLPVNMRLKLGGKVLRKHKVAVNNATLISPNHRSQAHGANFRN